jgi:uroporphyrinogen-III decarboxylase
MSNQDFLRRLWRLENTERPGIQFNAQANTNTTLLERFQDVDKMMRHQLAEMAARPPLRDDYVPAFFPYLGTAIFPSAFGCPVRWFEEQDPWAVSLSSEDWERLNALPDPTPSAGDLGRVLNNTRAMAAAPQGFPLRMTDIQGPLGVASLVVGEEQLMIAMYDQPHAVHALLEKITRLLTDFIRTQREIAIAAGREFIPCHYPPIWSPDGDGISISEDMVAILSPRLWKEFSLPYINELVDAFGGVFVHSCGDFRHNLPNLRLVRNLTGIDFAASEMSFSAVSDVFAGEAVLSVRLGLNKAIHLASIPAFVDHVLESCRTFRGLFLVVNLWYSMPGSGAPLASGDVERIFTRILGDQEAV